MKDNQIIIIIAKDKQIDDYSIVVGECLAILETIIEVIQMNL